MHMLLTLQHDPRNPAVDLHRHPTSAHIKRMQKYSNDLTENWSALGPHILDSELADLGSAFDKELTAFLSEALAPTLKALEAEEYGRTVQTATKVAQKRYVATRKAAESPLEAKIGQGDTLIGKANARYQANITVFAVRSGRGHPVPRWVIW